MISKQPQNFRRSKVPFWLLTSLASHCCLLLLLVFVDIDRQRIEDETRMETEKIREQSIADGEVSVARANAEVAVMMAKGELEVAKNVTKGDKGMLLCTSCRDAFVQ